MSIVCLASSSASCQGRAISGRVNRRETLRHVCDLGPEVIQSSKDAQEIAGRHQFCVHSTELRGRRKLGYRLNARMPRRALALVLIAIRIAGGTKLLAN